MDPPSPTSAAGVDDQPVALGEDAFNNREGGTESDNSGHYARKVLPEELSRSVVTLTCESAAEGGVCDVYLVKQLLNIPSQNHSIPDCKMATAIGVAGVAIISGLYLFSKK